MMWGSQQTKSHFKSVNLIQRTHIKRARNTDGRRGREILVRNEAQGGPSTGFWGPLNHSLALVIGRIR